MAALHADELPLDVALVRRLVSRALPQYAGLTVAPLATSGSDNALFRLGDDLIVRLPRQPGGSRSILKEARWLPAIGPRLPVRTPEVVAVCPPDLGYPEHWSLVTLLAGDHPEVVEPSSPPDPTRHRLAADLAAAVVALAEVDVPDGAGTDPGLSWYRGEPLACLDEDVRANLAHWRGLRDHGLDLEALERVWDEAMRLPGARSAPASPRWYHGDLAAENLLVQEGRLAGLLDFGGLGVGDPTVDLIVAWEVLDSPARETFRAALRVDDAMWLRGRAWALGIALMVWYYWHTMPRRRASRLAILRNVLADAGGPSY